MSDMIVSLPKMHASQAVAEKSAARFSVWDCGRRWGKDILMERRAVRRMLKKSAPYGWFAPSYRMMSENYRSLENRLAQVTARAVAGEHRLELVNGSVLEFWSLDNFNAARGRKYAHVTINEAAASPHLIDAWNYVIRPTLADMQGGADIGSTPKGLNGFYALWAQAADAPDWSRFQATTYDNPHIPKAEIDAMRQSMPERVFRQEILAEFVEDGAFFQGVDTCCLIETPDIPANHAGHRIFAGLDWALSEDFTVLTIACRDCAKVVDWWRSNRMDFTQQRAAIVQRLKTWGADVLPERNSIGAPNIEMLIDAGVSVLSGTDSTPGFFTSSTSKADLIQRLAAAIEHREIMAPAEYADELRAYEVQFSMSGNPKFSAPTGLHDDRVISLALAWYAMTATGSGIYL